MLSVAIKTSIIALLLIFILHFLIKNALQDGARRRAEQKQPSDAEEPPCEEAAPGPQPPKDEDLDDYFASIKAAPPPAPIQAPAPSPQRSAVAAPLGFDGMYGSSFSLL